MSLFPALEQRKSLDRAPDSDFWYQLVNYLKTSSGVSISEHTALDVTAVYSCINLISRHIGSMPLGVYERLPDGKKRLAVEHSNYPVLHIRPNPEMTAMSLRSTLQSHMLGWGTYYANIEWTEGYRRVKALWPLNPDRVTPVRSPVTEELEYIITLPKGEPRTLPAREVLRVNGLSFGGILGYSPINRGREAIGLATAAEKHAALFFSNGAIPGMVIKYPGKMSVEAEDRLLKSWIKAHGGLDNKHRLAILEEGLGIETIGLDPEVSQLLQTRRFQIEEIARLFNIPLHKISDLSRATFNNIEHLAGEYLTDCLLPYAVQNEQSFDHDLFLPKDRGKYFTEHNFEGLLRGDSQARAEFYRTMFNIGAFSPNMILAKENMNPIGEEGDFHMVQMNMIPLKSYTKGGYGEEPPVKVKVEEGNEDEDKGKRIKRTPHQETRAEFVWKARNRLRERHYDLLKEAAAQIVIRETDMVKRYVKSYLKNKDKEKFLAHIDDIYDNTMPDYIQLKMKPIINAYGDALAWAAREEIGVEQTEEGDAALDQFVANYTSIYATRHTGSSRGQIRAIVEGKEEEGFEGNVGLENEDKPDAVVERMDEWKEKRPDKIASDETVRLDGAVAHMIFAENGYDLMWVSVGHSCPYCESIDGMVVGREGYFLQQDQELQPPGEPPMHIRFSKRHPPAHQGCDCMIMAT